MLELLYNDLVGSFNKRFIEIVSTHAVPTIDMQSVFKQAKASEIKSGLLEFYVSAFIHHLRIDGSHLEVELYRESEGKKETLVKYMNSYSRDCGSLRLENYDYRMLFQRVQPQMLMQIFVSLLHERKVILILGGADAGGLTAEEDCSRNGAVIIETLLSLLYPLQWNFTNISCLIPSMIDYLEAPFPFIVCVSRDLWRHIYEHRWQAEQCQSGDEVVAFDLDAKRVHIRGNPASQPVDQQLPEFPQPYTQLLIQQLEKQLTKATLL